MLENFVSHLKLEKEEILKKAHECIEIEKDYYTGNVLRFELIYMIPTKLFIFEVNKGSAPIKMPHIKVLSVNFDVVHEPYMQEIEKQFDKFCEAAARPVVFVHLLDVDKIAYVVGECWRTIEIDSKGISTKYVNVSPYYMDGTEEYDQIMDLTFEEVEKWLSKELQPLYSLSKTFRIINSIKKGFDVNLPKEL